MKRALILGGTARNSLGRAIAREMSLHHHVRPILVGRSADEARDGWANSADLIKADLMDLDVAKNILQAIDDPSDIAYLVVAGGVHLRGNLSDHSLEQQRQLWRTVAEGPVEVVAAFHAATKQPYHLITVASTSATVIRSDETIYAMAQAARRSFALNFHAELIQRTGSKNLVVCPGGMKTGLWASTDTDMSKFFDPTDIAKQIVDLAVQQKYDYREFVEKTIKREYEPSFKYEDNRVVPMPEVMRGRLRQAFNNLPLNSAAFSCFYAAFCFRRSVSGTGEGQPGLSAQHRIIRALNSMLHKFWHREDPRKWYVGPIVPVPEGFKEEVLAAFDHVEDLYLNMFAREMVELNDAFSLQTILEGKMFVYDRESRDGLSAD